MLLTDTSLIFRDVKPLARLGAATKYLSFTGLFAGALSGMTPPPSQLRLVPPDLWPGDAQRGRDMVAGVFRFAGQTIERNRLSWEPEEASPEWITALHSFEWLRDLRAAGGERARRMAREMVALWLSQYSKPQAVAWRADITGMRLAAWISCHDFFCASADEGFRRNYFSSLSRQARYLSKVLPEELHGLPLLRALRGLAYAGLVLEGGEDGLERAFRLILRQLREQVLPDGTHVSRSPQATFETLQCLVDLRTALIAAKADVPEDLQHAIDRLTPAVKLFRHGDGALAQFNGGQEGSAHLCETALMHSGARGKAMKSLSQGGYERLSQGRSCVIMDTGVPLSSAYSARAHAGLLSFEYSFGRERVMVNCGTVAAEGKWQRVLRSTLAHSTLSVDQRNALQLDGKGPLSCLPDVQVQRHEDEGVAQLEASHDGYMPRYGLTYRRLLRLQDHGDVLSGEEHLSGKSGAPFTLRFHLHPGMQVISQDGGRVLLRSASGLGWRFHVSSGVTVSIEDSVYAGMDEQPRPTLQIVLTGVTAQAQAAIAWELSREKA